VVVSSNSNTHTTVLLPFFPGPPAWGGARRELLDSMLQWNINSGRHTDQPDGCDSIRTNQCPPPPSPQFFTGRMPFLPPNQQCQITECNYRIWIREKMLELSSTVLPAPSPYRLVIITTKQRGNQSCYKGVESHAIQGFLAWDACTLQWCALCSAQ